MVFARVDDRPCRRPNSQRFSRPVRFSSTEAYCPVTPTSWRIMCGSRRTSTPKMLGLAVVDRQQGGEHPQHRGLAGAVGAEHAEDLAAADLEVDAVDRALVAEGLDQAGGGDGQVGVREMCHAHSVRARGFTPPSRRFQLIGWLTASRKWSKVGPSPVMLTSAPSPRRHSHAFSAAGGPGDDGVRVGAGVGDDVDVVVVVVRAVLGVGADEPADLHPDPVAGVGAVDADVAGEAVERAPRRAPAVHDVEALQHAVGRPGWRRAG